MTKKTAISVFNWNDKNYVGETMTLRDDRNVTVIIDHFEVVEEWIADPDLSKYRFDVDSVLNINGNETRRLPITELHRLFV